ncbi:MULTISPECIES: PAQR family membrane homeostasis protein TrhA [unclassified Nocardioides]|uniref:PAQR family membrane homeostasis protein TrhA n=1 Tax=unclassified Nocardioides TaxID=2615069 RepID=UPI0006FFD3C1|nr:MULTISPECIES: hemolysin III family protein [unclassified Nocardioides]KRA38195.1 DNA-binding protein [Nocardioides sp. Root614]KRA92155.1 DNA-binding protein [Nocardioides sp. Root682]
MSQAFHESSEKALARLDAITESISETLADVKPKLRGWIHLASTPLVIAAGIVLICLSPTATTRVGSIFFVASAILLFGCSALYHRGTWSPKVWKILNRLDHSNIFVFIAGSYTPFALILLDGTAQVVMLVTAWTSALLGIAFKVFWPSAPRWMSAPIYIAMGWAALFFLPAFYDGATALGLGVGIAIFVLIATGGALYTLGGLVYGFQWPNPSPRVFGFHEVFHGFTIVAFVTHYVGVSMATYALR